MYDGEDCVLLIFLRHLLTVITGMNFTLILFIFFIFFGFGFALPCWAIQNGFKLLFYFNSYALEIAFTLPLVV